ncbi:MAG: DMT family transporter, partial [Rikenellaceae bacterium]
LAPFLIGRKVEWSVFKDQWQYLLFFAFFQTFLQYWLFYAGLIIVPAAVGAIIVGLGPIFVTILAHFFLGQRDRLSMRKVFAMVFGFAGVIFISVSTSEMTTVKPFFYWGVIALVLSCLVGCITNIIIARRPIQLDHIALNSVSCFVGGVMLLVTALFTEQQEIALIKPLPPAFYVAMIWLSGIPALGFSIWYFLLSRPNISVSEINIIKFLIPVFGVILSWLIVKGESFNIQTVIGTVIIAAAIIIIQLPTKNKVTI